MRNFSFVKARELGLPISTHTGIAGDGSQRQALLDNGLLGPDVQILHALREEAPAAECAQMGVKYSLFPTTDHVPPMPEMISAGVSANISVDNTASWAADMFSLMRVVPAEVEAKTGES